MASYSAKQTLPSADKLVQYSTPRSSQKQSEHDQPDWLAVAQGTLLAVGDAISNKTFRTHLAELRVLMWPTRML